MKLVVLFVLSIISSTNCGLLKGLTDTFSNGIQKVSDGVHSAISVTENKGSEMFTNVVNTLDKSAQNIAGQIKNVLPCHESGNIDQSLPTDDEEKVEIKITCHEFSTPPSNTENNNNHMENYQTTDSKIEHYKGAVRATDGSYYSDIKSEENTNNDPKRGEKSADEVKSPCENEVNTTCISADMLRFGDDARVQSSAGKEFYESKAFIEAGCLQGFSRAEDGACQPIEE